MDAQQYRKEIDRTMNDELTPRAKLSMLGLGIAGEAGELVDSIKKHVYHGHEMDIEDLTKELGDLDWYITHLKKHFGITDEEVREKNIAKLRKRYAEGFSEEASKNREEYGSQE